MTAFVFPGQGSQSIGMGKAFFDDFSVSRQVFEEANDTLRVDLKKLIFEGDPETLTQTVNAQPALLTVSLAILAAIEQSVGIPPSLAFMAGHSLGEYTALCAARSLKWSDAMRLVRYRGQAMQDAVPFGDGAMAAVLGLSIEEIEALMGSYSQAEKMCVVANDNCPGQVVISGHKEAVAEASEKAKQMGAKRAVTLPVSAPFHSPLMQPAAKRMEEALAEVDVHPLQYTVFANTTTEPFIKENIKPTLVSQITGRVRWRETVKRFEDAGVTQVIEIGAGNVLTGLNQRTSQKLQCLSVQTPADLKNLEKLRVLC